MRPIEKIVSRFAFWSFPAKIFFTKMNEPLKEYNRFIFRFLIDRAEITPERNITFNFVDGSSEIYFCPAKPKYARK